MTAVQSIFGNQVNIGQGIQAMLTSGSRRTVASRWSNAASERHYRGAGLQTPAFA
jgi:hypothetical protein